RLPPPPTIHLVPWLSPLLLLGPEFPVVSDQIITQKRPLISGDKHFSTDAAGSRSPFHRNIRVALLLATAALILGWWISATEQAGFDAFPSSIIAFRFIPNSAVTRPVAAVWVPVVQQPWYRIPRRLRLAIGWSCLIAFILASAFGFPLSYNSDYGHRAISVLGLLVFQCGFYLSSTNRSEICWPTVVTGLFIQQAVALFVLKTSAGYSIFRYIANLAEGFLTQADVGAEFFFDAATIAKNWFFVNTLAAIIFFIATIQMLYYVGFAWFFFKLMNVSGAEAVVAAASPWVGLGESACLVKPYVDTMTASELHLCMTSAQGFSTISGAVLSAYISFGVPPQNLIHLFLKMRVPETEEPVTRGRVIVDRASKIVPVNALHAFSRGGLFGLKVAGYILTNVLIILSLVSCLQCRVDTKLTLKLILGYVAYPVTFLLGVPSPEIFTFAAYTELAAIQASSNPLSSRAFTIASYSLCGFANLGSLGIQIGVLSALAPSQAKVIARMATSAMICGFIS
ncbi:Na+ dependent nucleoside transporter C-terminus-domain-containing protein, partial [Pisolithus microcarpus]